jgi:signal transduction histidine kinase
MWREMAGIFLLTALVVILIAFLASSITAMRFSRPMKEIADAAREFGHGNFTVRVDVGQREDEVADLANAFNTMADSLERNEMRRSEFIANVSHELKTPMTTIAGFADGILDGTIPPERERESLQVISSETRRLSRLVRQMLDLSRLQADGNRMKAQEQFDLSEVLLRVLVSLEGRITQRGLDVEAQIPERKIMVWGDPDSITQVCYNLLDNAAKFAQADSAIHVGITTRENKALVTVRNLGETIPEQDLPRLFDRFHKADQSRSRDRDGVGLGLYIVKTILGNMKENITVTSRDGVTEFVFTLTLA